MSEHRYILEPYNGMKTRFRCPSCQRSDKTFSLYIDTETGGHLHTTVGRCNRESNCGHHYTPKQFFQDNPDFIGNRPLPKVYKKKTVTLPQRSISSIDVEVFKASLKSHDENHFVKFLIDRFGVEVASQLVSRYFIATSKHWNGATVFWQIDTKGKVRTGKIMLYNPTTGKRIKEPRNHINWVHSVLQLPEYNLQQCLFGEHLLQDKTKPVAIVESEKTAVIASVYLPQFIWVAVGSLTNLNTEKCSILKGRTVTLFPDLNGFEKWRNKAKELSSLTSFQISDLLERKATVDEKKQGFDLADYLITLNLKVFALPELGPTEPPSTVQTLVELTAFKQPETANYFSKPEQPKPSWEQEISELEKYFKGITLPTQHIKLNRCSTITSCSLFIESHIATIKANNGNRSFLPYLNRLHELKQVLMNEMEVLS